MSVGLQIRTVKMSEQNSDSAFWNTQTYAQRLQALEDIRAGYIAWKYSDAEQEFQRVYRVAQFE